MAKFEMKGVEETKAALKGTAEEFTTGYEYTTEITCGKDAPDKGGGKGWYKAVCLKSQFTTAQSSGAPMFKFVFGIDGDKGGVRANYQVMKPTLATAFRERVFRGLGYLEAHQKGIAVDLYEFVGLEAWVKPRVEKGDEEKGYQDKIGITDFKSILGDNQPSRRFTPPPENPDEIEGDAKEPAAAQAGADDTSFPVQ